MKLEEWKEICPKCEGKGRVIDECGRLIQHPCSKCLGSGKFDWLEKIYGKKEFLEKYIVKNLTNKRICIEDVGIGISPNATINLSEYLYPDEIEKSFDLKNKITSKILKIEENNIIEEYK